MTSFIMILAEILISVLLLIVALKVIWNVALPYGLLRMRTRRPVSLFPLIELVPLAGALLIAWCGNTGGWLSVRTIVNTLGYAVLFSYAHFMVVALFVGLAMRARSSNENETRQNGGTKGDRESPARKKGDAAL